jgi:hypothetical protein
MDLSEISWKSASEMLQEDHPFHYELFGFDVLKVDAFVWLTDNFRTVDKLSKFSCFRDEKKISQATIQQNGKITLYEMTELVQIGDFLELRKKKQKSTITLYVHVVEYYPKQSFNMLTRTAACIVVIDNVVCT